MTARADHVAVRQAYLCGPTLRLRAPEQPDAATEPSWSERWFPRARAVAEGRIESEQASGSTLVAVRNCDDVIAGSVTIEREGSWSSARPFAARWLDAAQADVVEAEIVTLILPFLVEEEGAIAALTTIASGKPAVQAALERIGARFCFRWREAWQLRGQRRDMLGYQLMSQRLAERIGQPEITPEAPVEREVRSPASRRWPVVAIPPEGAVTIGERLYLRPWSPGDAELLSDALHQETEFLHEPRWPASALDIDRRFRTSSESESPDQVIFAIVERESGELIGHNKLKGLDLVHRSAETATRIYRPHDRGHGYGAEAKHLLLRYAFETLNLHMVWANVWDHNPRSRTALQKQGYRLAGSLPWRQLHHGLPTGDWTFDLLASEWKDARR